MAETASCHCPHCGVEYPFVPQLIARPVRCRQCRQNFIVDDDGSTRALISNRPNVKLESEDDSSTALPSEMLANEDNGEVLGLREEALEPKTTARNRPATRRFSTPGTAAPPRRKTSLIMRGMRPQQLASGIQEALRQSQAERSPAVDAPSAPPVPNAVDAPPRAQPQRRPSLGGGRRNTETIMRGLRSHVLGREGGTAIGLNAGIARAVADQGRVDEDRGDESTRAIAVRRGADPYGDSEDPTSDGGVLVHCPHCDEGYPYRATLLDRNIRCRSCQGVFRVFPDATSEPVIANRALPDMPTPVQPPAAHGVPPKAKGRTQVLRNRELMKAMSSSLAEVVGGSAMQQALAQRAAPIRQATPDRAAALANPVHGVAESQLRRAHRWWLLSAVVAVVLLALALSVILRTSIEEQAIRSFAQAGIGETSVPERQQAMRAVAWPSAHPVQTIIGMRRPRLQSRQRVNMPDLANLSRAFAGMVPDMERQFWVAEDLREDLQQRHAELQRQGVHRREEMQTILSEEFAILSPDHVRAMVDKVATTTRAREVLADIFALPGSDLAQRLLRNPPQAMELQPFAGSDGRLLLSTGALRSCTYRGLLLRFIGEGWDGQWRVVQVTASGVDHRLPPP